MRFSPTRLTDVSGKSGIYPAGTVKVGERVCYADLMSASGVGWLIQAMAGSCGGAGGWWAESGGVVGVGGVQRGGALSVDLGGGAVVHRRRGVYEAAVNHQVDRTTIMRIRTVAKEGALAALAAPKPGTAARQGGGAKWPGPAPRRCGHQDSTAWSA